VVAPATVVTGIAAGVPRPYRSPNEIVWSPGATFTHVVPHSSAGYPSMKILPGTGGFVVTRSRAWSDTDTIAEDASSAPFPSFTRRTAR